MGQNRAESVSERPAGVHLHQPSEQHGMHVGFLCGQQLGQERNQASTAKHKACRAGTTVASKPPLPPRTAADMALWVTGACRSVRKPNPTGV